MPRETGSGGLFGGDGALKFIGGVVLGFIAGGLTVKLLSGGKPAVRGEFGGARHGKSWCATSLSLSHSRC